MSDYSVQTLPLLLWIQKEVEQMLLLLIRQHLRREARYNATLQL